MMVLGTRRVSARGYFKTLVLKEVLHPGPHVVFVHVLSTPVCGIFMFPEASVWRLVNHIRPPRYRKLLRRIGRNMWGSQQRRSRAVA